MYEVRRPSSDENRSNFSVNESFGVFVVIVLLVDVQYDFRFLTLTTNNLDAVTADGFNCEIWHDKNK
jgi:hypothetical protein